MYETAEYDTILDLIPKKPLACASGEKHVLFRLGGMLFCLPAKNVRGIMGVGSLIPAGNSSLLLIGFLFCQAKALPVLDIRPPLGLPAPALCGGKEEVLVLTLASDARFRIGVLVESLENSCEIHVDAVNSQPHSLIPRQFLSGVARCNGQEIIMLDLDCLISPTALRRLSNIA